MKTLAKETGLLNVDKQSGAPIFTPQLFQGFRQIIANGQLFVHETYFDLNGLSIEEKTVFFEGATVQEFANPSHVGGAVGDLTQVIDIMSALPLNDTQLQNCTVFANGIETAFPTFDQTIYFRNNIFLVDVDFLASGYFSLLSSNQMGSLGPTASDRIYVYKLVIFGDTNAATSVTVYPSRFLLQMEAREEPEFQHIMRLKRSYDLQQSYDED